MAYLTQILKFDDLQLPSYVTTYDVGYQSSTKPNVGGLRLISPHGNPEFTVQ